MSDHLTNRTNPTSAAPARGGETRVRRLGLASQLLIVGGLVALLVLSVLFAALWTSGQGIRRELQELADMGHAASERADEGHRLAAAETVGTAVALAHWQWLAEGFGAHEPRRPTVERLIETPDGPWKIRVFLPEGLSVMDEQDFPAIVAAARLHGAPTQWLTLGGRGDRGHPAHLRLDPTVHRADVTVIAPTIWIEAAVRSAHVGSAPAQAAMVDEQGRLLAGSALLGENSVSAPLPGLPWTLKLSGFEPAGLPSTAGEHKHVDAGITELLRRIGELRTALLALLALTVVVLVPLLALFFHVRVTRPLVEAGESVRLITRGNLDHKVVTRWDDEVGSLARHINDLTDQLRRSRDRLRDYNRTLEREVEERTEALARRQVESGRLYRDLETAYVKLQTTQAQLIQQERMATLGQLLAGIAHEINNPINYLTNAVPPLQSNLEKLRRVLRALDDARAAHGSVGPVQWAEIDRLRSSLGWADIDQDISDSIQLIRNGAERTARIVTNLRAFSRTPKGHFGDVDLGACLDVTLSLLSHLMKGRVDVQRDYEVVPPIEASQGEINQVFMNLLANACQAIEGSGTVFVRVRRDGDGVAVDIRDSGAGIAESVLPRIFEPFFTTKSVEQGTGLGLSISYRIVVEQHHGRIDVASVVGEGTEFTVWLPLRQPSVDRPILARAPVA